MKVGIQMDPLSSINIDGDSSFRLGLEAQALGLPRKQAYARLMALRATQDGGA